MTSPSPPTGALPEIGDLRAFCAAVDLGSISRAGRLLYISQPAVSKRIRNLERMAGTPLLVRAPAGVRSTAAGQRLYAEARRMLVHAELVGELLEASRGSLVGANTGNFVPVNTCFRDVLR